MYTQHNMSSQPISMFIREPITKTLPKHGQNKIFSSNTYHLIYQELHKSDEFKKMVFDEVKHQRDNVFRIMHEQKLVTPKLHFGSIAT